MGKTDSNMETHTQTHLDDQEVHVRLLTTQLEALQQSHKHQSSIIQEHQEKCQGMLLQLMKRLDKQPMLDDDRDSPNHTTVSPNPSIPLPRVPLDGYPPPGLTPLPQQLDFSHFDV